MTVAHLTERICHDVDDQAQSLGGWHQHYDQIGRGRFLGRAWQRQEDQGGILRETTNCHLSQRVAPPVDTVVLAVPMAVMPGSSFAGRPLTRDSFLVLGGGEEYELQVAGDFDVIGLTVHRDLVNVLPSHKVEWLARAEALRSQPLQPDVADIIRRTLMVWVDRDAAGSTVQDLDWLNATLTQTVVLAMHSEQQGQTSALARHTESRQRVVRRAVDYMHAHLFDEVSVQDICQAACASRRTLQYSFEECLQTTPLAYLRALRLNEARRLLRQSQRVSITEMAYAMGFSSASHFSQHYRLMFGMPPSETPRGQAVDLAA